MVTGQKKNKLAPCPLPLAPDLLKEAKEYGFSDKYIARLINSTEDAVREYRKKNNIISTFKMVDTCAAEFVAYTPYFYSTYEQECEANPTDRPKVVILGSGPNRIGQGIEFDYSCVHASFALSDAGYETVMVNCNPETVSTDYDTSDPLSSAPPDGPSPTRACPPPSTAPPPPSPGPRPSPTRSATRSWCARPTCSAAAAW